MNMVVANDDEQHDEVVLPEIDLRGERGQVSKLIVKACEDYGFFKVINHGVPMDVISKLEDESLNFFAKPSSEKEKAAGVSPYGYGCKNIGLNGDVGEVEYLILDAAAADGSVCSSSSSQPAAACLSTHPINFRAAVSSYVKSVRELACEILDLLAEGLGVGDGDGDGVPLLSSSSSTSLFSSFILDPHTDSLLRLNHYPPLRERDTSPSSISTAAACTNRIGFGEHTDPQILTLLRSNGVGGLQISVQDGVWVPVAPHPTAFFVNVGDLLQAMTNGRLMSVRHRAMVNWYESRISMAYFASPPLGARIGPLPHLVTPHTPRLYRSFTWADYKKATYSARLGDSRLNFFRIHPNDDATSLPPLHNIKSLT